MIVTLANLKDATGREIFNQIKEHLLTQMERSVDKHGDCVYRNEYGLRCAAGCLVADEEYDPDMEGQGWFDLIDKGFVSTSRQRDMIDSLQSLHDKVRPEDWPGELDTIEKRWL